MKRMLLLFLVLTLAYSTSIGFDGTRKGFILGGGLGVGIASNEVDEINAGWIMLRDRTQSFTGVNFNFMIGYAVDNQNAIVYLREAIVYGYETKDQDETIGKAVVMQGFSGLAYFHYFGPVGKSAFVNVGIGFQSSIYFDNQDIYGNNPGLGILLGGGYEFTRHIQVSASYAIGRTSDIPAHYKNSQFSISISALAF